MATLSEWEQRFEALIDEIEADGFDVEFTTCCCGEGYYIAEKQGPISMEKWAG